MAHRIPRPLSDSTHGLISDFQLATVRLRERGDECKTDDALSAPFDDESYLILWMKVLAHEDSL